MDTSSLFKNFAIDTWYKAVVYLSAIVFVVSLFSTVKGLTNSQLQLLSGGAFLFCLGEWKNHKIQSWICTSHHLRPLEFLPLMHRPSLRQQSLRYWRLL